MVLAFRVAQAKIDVDAAASLLEHIVERGAIALAVEGVHHVEPARGRAAERAAREAKLHFDLGAHMHLVAGNVPVINRIARAGERQRLAFRGPGRAVQIAAAREGMLHDGEADKEDDERKPAEQHRRGQIIVDLPGDHEGRGHDPGEQHQPGRNERDGAVIALMDGEEDDEQETDRGDSGKRDARHARRHRRVHGRKADEGEEEEEPQRHDVAVAHVPAVEVEIGEEEDERRCRERRFGRRLVDAQAFGRQARELLHEAEIDGDVDEDRPGKRRGGGEHHGALDHDDDREKQRQKADDADDDAAIEGQPVHLLLVSVQSHR